MKNKIIKLFILLILTIFSSLFLPKKIKISAFQIYDSTYFENLTEQQGIDFINDHNITIPYLLIEPSKKNEFIKSLIQKYYNNPNSQVIYNYEPLQIFATEIKQSVLKYVTTNNISRSSNIYQLQYNTVQNINGQWVTSGGKFLSKWEFYNCYAYAIKRTEIPNYYTSIKPYSIGQISGLANTIRDYTTNYELAQIIASDLLTIGHSNISISYTIPSITSAEELICFRTGCGDFHFMRYDLDTDAWYHKPGQTAILKYNYTPNNNELWFLESSNNGVENISYDQYYDSEIIYIKFQRNTINLDGTSTTKVITLGSGKDNIFELNNSASFSYNYLFVSPNEIQVSLYDDDMNLITTHSGTSINYFQSLTNSKYYLRVNYLNPYDYGDMYAIFTYHNHTFGSPYTWVNYTQHRTRCSGCNITKLEGHVVSNGSISGGVGYAPCLLCGGNAQVGFIQIQSIIKRSINGSYILSNGIIVLVEEDYNDFFKGNLKFFNSNIIELKA